MRLAIAGLVTATLLFPLHIQAQATPAPRQADIQKLLQDRDDARHRGDWRAYAQFFTADATVVNSDGASASGRPQIQKTTQDQWGTGVYKGARIRTTVESVHAIAPNVAVADARFEITNIAAGGTRRGRTTFILVRSGDGWKIAASRSMVPTAAGAVRQR